MKATEKPISFLNHRGEKLWGFLHLPQTSKPAPGVIICHGYNQTKSFRFQVALSKALAENGFASLRFDFAGSGESEGKLENTSITSQLAELEAAYKLFKNHPQVNENKIVLAGHSLGALIALLLHVKLKSKSPLILIVPALDQRKLIPTWYSEEEIALCLKQGYLDTIKGRIGAGYIKEAIENNWLEKTSSVQGPTLIVQGVQDDDVPLKYSEEVFARLPEPKEFIKVQETDYKFRNPKHQKALNDAVLVWLKKHL